jgi:glutathione peroxidase
MKNDAIKFGLNVLLALAALTLNVMAQDNGKTAAAPKPAPKLVVNAATYDFGQVKEGEEVSHTFIVRNEGKAELVITNVSPACGCTASNFSKSVAPNSEGLITLSVKTAGMSGPNERYADIISNDTQNAFYKLWLKLDVVKAVANETTKMADKTVLDFTLKNIDGKETVLSEYKGKALLLVNVASKCGYTPQYEGLQALYTKYKDQGLVVIGIPANNFGAQEPGTNEEIKQFCTLKYNVSFPMFAKISVKGDDIHPLYKFLTDKTTNPQFGGDIKWNFNKFLVGRDGKIIARFESGDKPEGEKVMQAVEQALKN